MPLDRNKIHTIYSALKGNGDYEADYTTFENEFAGNENYKKRKAVYDTLKKGGADVGSTYEEFMQRMQSKQQSSAHRQEASAPKQESSALPSGVSGFPSPQKSESQHSDTQQTPMAHTPASDSMVQQLSASADRHADGVRLPQASFRDASSLKSPFQRHGEAQIAKSMMPEQPNLKQGQLAMDGKGNAQWQMMEAPASTDTGITYTADEDGNPQAHIIGEEGSALRLSTEEKEAKERREYYKSLDDRITDLDRRIEQGYQDTYGRDVNARRGSYYGITPTAQASRESILSSEAKDYMAAQNLMKTTKRMQEAAQRYKDNPDALIRFAKDTGISFLSSLTDFSTWDFGMQSADEAIRVRNLYGKFAAKGEAALTPSERDLLDAVTLNTAAQMTLGDKQGIGNTVGQTSAEMLPFMIEMLVNPASGVSKEASKATAKAIARYAAKRFLQGAMKKGTAKALSITGKYGSRFLYDLGAGAVMSATTSAPHVVADAERRRTGTLFTDENGNRLTDADGNVGYQGDSAASAYAKAFGARTIENQSELFGDAFLEPLTSRLGKFILRGIETKAGGRALGKILTSAQSTARRAANTSVGRTFSKLNKGAHYNGIINEYLEEVVGNFENAATVGDNNFKLTDDEGNISFHEDNSVFNFDDNFATFLAVAVPGIVQGAASHAQYQALSRIAGRGLSRSQDFGFKVFGWGDWLETMQKVDGIDFSDSAAAASQVKAIVQSDATTADQAYAITHYAQAAAMSQSLDLSQQMQEEEETSDLIEAIREERSKGSEIDNHADAHAASREADQAEADLGNIQGGADIKQQIDDILAAGEQGGTALNAMLNGLTPEQRPLAEAYIASQSRINGIEETLLATIDQQVEDRRAELAPHLSTEGTFATIDIDGQQRYVKGFSEDMSTVYYFDEEGKVQSAPVTEQDLADSFSGWQEAEDYLSSYRSEMEQAAYANVNSQLENHPSTVTDLTAGAEYSVPVLRDGETHMQRYQVISADEQTGTVTVIPMTYKPDAVTNEDGTKSAAWVAAEGADPISMPREEAIRRQNEAHDAYDQRQAEQEAGANLQEEEGENAAQPEQDAAQPEQDASSANEQTIAPKEEQDASPSGVSGFPSPQQENQQQSQSALSRIPLDEQGQPIYEQTDPDTAWDAILEQTEGDADMAQSIAADMVTDKESALKKAQSAKPRKGATVAEKIAAQKEYKAAIDRAQSDLDHWKQIAATQQRRQEAEAARKAAEEDSARKAAEAAAAAESEAPEWHEDTPQAARARGYRRQGGHTYRRQAPVQSAHGKEVEVKFADNVKQKAIVTVIDASTLQPSHMNGKRNISFFIDEAQPKERDGQESTAAAEKIASSINPEEITSSVTAYTGAPTVNTRGEVIQGNNRSAALKAMWQNHPEQAEAYKLYLIDHAADFGLRPEAIDFMASPVLVNMADVEDDRAITLGQYTASDTESGGTERIKAKATAQKMGADMTGFTSRLLRSEDEDETISQLIDANAVETLKWMQRQGYITPTQYRSAFDRKGNLTAEAANDLKSILYETIFQGGSTQLREMFAELPAKAQKAILAIAHRDYDSPSSERILPELQRSIIAYHELSHFAPFAKAKGMEELQNAIIMWQRQYQIDETTGESHLPSEKYSNFALQLAAMYKGQTQRLIQSTLSRMLDLIQGKQEQDLFSDSTSDNTPRTLAEAIREVLNIEYNGKNGSNVLGSDDAASPDRSQGSPRSDKQDQQGTRSQQPADNTGGTEAYDNNTSPKDNQTEQRLNIRDPRTMSYEEKQLRGDMLRDATAIEVAEGQIVAAEGMSARKAAEQWWQDNVPEAVLYDTEAGEVEINQNSVKDSLAHRYGQAKLDAVTSLVEGFENAVYLGSMPDSNRQEGVMNHYYAYPITYKGERCYVFCRAMQDANKNRLYVHEVFIADKIKEGDTLQTAAFQPHGGISIYKGILANVLFASKGTDISSEPQENAKKSSADDEKKSLSAQIDAASAEVNTHPTEAQKEAGNYKKGHVQVGTFDITIEQPEGSVRRGTDANGKQWESKMHNTYGYIRGTEGVDGDHIDVFLSTDIDSWNGREVFVVDQYNPDGTFDEHKVMLGFNDLDEAKSDYLANYEEGWADGRRIDVSAANLENFEKWIASSHRKTKPFSEYSSVSKTTIAYTPAKEKFIATGQERTNIREDGMLVDENGKPMTLYHGTPDKSLTLESLEAGHTRIGEEEAARFGGDGISFSPDRSVALDYSNGEKGNVIEARIFLKKPYYTVGVANFTPEEAKAFSKRLKSEGYDGIINYSSQSMRDMGNLPSEVIVFDKSSLRGVKDESPASTEESATAESRLVSSLTEDEKEDLGYSFIDEHPMSDENLHPEMVIDITEWMDEHPTATIAEARAAAERMIDEFNEENKRLEQAREEAEKEENQFRNGLYQAMLQFKDTDDTASADAALSQFLESLSPEHLMDVATACLHTILTSKGKDIADWQATAMERTAHHLKRLGITVKKGRSGLKEGDRIATSQGMANGTVRSIDLESKTVTVLSNDGRTDTYPLSKVKGYIRQSPSAPNPLERAATMEAERKAKQKQDDLRRRSLREAPASVLPKATQSILSKIAKSFGAEVRYLPTDADSNGLYDPETNTIYLVQDANEALSFVFGHELTHMVKSFSQESYDRLLAAAKQVLGSRFSTFASEKETLYRSHGYNYGRDYYEEEAAADTIGSMIDNGGMAKSILRRLTHPVLTRILDALDRVINLFRGEKAKRAAHLRKEIEQAIAAAATPSKRQSDGQTRHAFSGEKGATAADRAESSTVRRENLSIAKTMLSEGKDAKAIKLATGWEMGKDGKWRREVPDAAFSAPLKDLLRIINTTSGDERQQALHIANNDYDTLGSSIKADEIFKAYPQLKNVRLIFDDTLPKEEAGHYSAKHNAIVINANDFHPEMQSTLIHELQHAIQRIEGFATGGSTRTAMEYLSSGTPDSRFDDISIKKQVALELSQKNNLGLTKEEVSSLIDNLEDDSYPEDKLQQQIDGLCAKHGITEDQLEDIYDMDRVWHEAYRRIAGEVEARNVQTRRRMTEDERRDTLASETEDVPRHNQIVLRHSLRESDRALRDALIDHMRSFGMDVITDEKEGQRVLDMANKEDVKLSAKKRRALETASVSHSEKHQPTVVSSADGAKVLKELDTAKEKYKNLSNQSKTFLGDVAKALGAQRQGSASEYASFETKNGRIVTIRLANHNATVSNFDHRGESDGISIVVSPKKSEGITNDGTAHVVEYFYDSIKLRRADGKPLADIVRSIKQALYSGEFTDTTGLAERQEVNADEVVRFQKVYHGSGADFDRFDHSHMSEGQGAQAYGWGTYVTEVEGIAEGYADMTSRLVLSNGEGSEWMRKRIHDDIISHFNVENGISEIEVSAQGTLNGLDINMDTLPAWQHYFIQHPEDFDPLRSPKDPQSYNFENRKEEKAFYESIIASINAYAESRRSAYMENSVKVKNLYTVDIPDDTGENYLPYDKPLTHAQIETIRKGLAHLMESPAIPDSFKEKLLRANNGYPPVISIPEGSTGEQAYRYIADEIFDEYASKFLSSLGFTGIKYPANYRSGGNKEGKSNYVIFNEADAKITDRVRFFRTPEGEAYGYTIGGKIYIDPRIATSETPIHEYTHLWATALRQQDPSAWQGIVSAMKGTSLWREVKDSYKELDTDDDIADEVLAHYSGKRGSERLTAEMSKLTGENRSDPFAKAAAMQAISRVRSVLRTFWRKIASLLHIPMERTTDADTIADTVLSDLLGRVDPRAAIEADAINTDSRTRFHKVTDKAELDRLNSEPTQKAYRAMQVIDGKLYPPMAAKVNGKMVESNELGEWIRADENKDLAIAEIDKKTGKQKLDKNGEPMWKFKLVKGSKDATGKAGTTIPAAYNPYWHMSRSPLNDQFKSAWIRPNIVIVECEFPASELTSGYKAERAKNAVGEVDWKSGVVSGEVYQQTGRARKVILSRWCKPVRVLSNEEVAEKAKEFIGDAKVVIPENVITPQQRIAFEAAGLTIGEPETGMKKTEQVQEAIKAGLTVDNTLRHSLRDDKSHASPLDRAASMEAERKGKAADKPQSLDEIPSEWKNSKLQASQAVHADSPLEISDEAFTEYTQSVILPRPSEEMEKVLGGNAKPILIKRGIFAKNDLTHGGLTKNGLTPEQSRAILNDALYSGNLVGKTQPATKPDYWVVIRTSKKNKVVVLEVSKSKDFLEVVGWEYRDEQKLQRLYNQARKNRGEIIEIQKEDGGEDGLSLIQNPVRSSAADLSALTPSSDGKGTDISSESQENAKNSSADDEKKSLSAQIEVASPTDGSTTDPLARARSMAEESRKRKIESDPAVSHLRTQTDPSAPSERRYSLRGQRMQNPAAAQVSASYDAACASRLFKIDEAWHDYLASVRHAISEIEKATGKHIPEWANPYMHALIKSSKDSAEYADCTRDYLIPLQESVQKLMRSSHMTLKDVEFYLMAKHGLERNAVMRKRNAEEAARKKYAPQRMVIEKEHKSGKMSDADYNAKIQALDAQEQADYAANMSDGAKKYHKDYAGFTQMFSADEAERETITIQELTSRAEAHVISIEQQCDPALIDDVWQRIKAANGYSLKRTLDSGLISQETYDSISNMYEHYIPLRGHEDTEASEVYDYFIDSEPSRINSVVKKASGRKSQAGNILANIMSMCNSSIVQANKNELKQKLYNLASVYPSDLLGVSKVWYVRKFENGQPTDEWIPAHPSESKLAAATTAAERQQVYAEFEQEMRRLKDIDEAREGRSDLDLRYPIDAHLKRQHEVKVSIDGIDYIVYVNGNPRLAQALNGTLNYDAGQGWAMRTWAKIMRFKGKAITSANPDFMASNLQRDIISALTVSDAKYGADYRKKLAKNINANIPLFSVLSSASKGQQHRSAGIYELYKLYDKRTLDMTDPRQRMFDEFIRNGGETGVSQMFSVQDYQRTVDAYMREDLMSQLKHIAGVIDSGIEAANRGIENAVRFAAYCTSRESGKSIADSIYDAKEASVNFNRKGSGHLFNSFARNMYIFLNPAVQGTVQYLELLSKHPQSGTINAVAGMSRRAVRSFVGFSVLGAVLTLANYLLTGCAGDGDDGEIDNDYAQTSSFVRRSNVMIPCGNGLFGKIALAPETRLPYGIGCIAAEYALGMHTSPHWAQDLTLDVAAQVASVMPLDLYDERFAARDSKSDILTNLATGAVKGLIPTQIEPLTDAYLFNEDFAGRKIAWRPDKPYLPEYKYSNDNTNRLLVNASRIANNLAGGSDYRRSALDTKVLNPAIVEYVLTSYTGAYTEYPSKLYKSILAATGNEDYQQVRNIPLVNRLCYSIANQYDSNQTISSLYREIAADVDRTRSEINAIRSDRSLSQGERTRLIRGITSSPRGELYLYMTAHETDSKSVYNAVKTLTNSAYDIRESNRDRAKMMMQRADDLKRKAVKRYLQIYSRE